MSNTRSFHLSDVLSVTTGRLVSTRHMDGLYDILQYMTGTKLFTNQLPSAGDVCGPELLKQHPQLSQVDPSTITRANWKEWLDEQVARFGETLTVTPLPPGGYLNRGPVGELRATLANK